MPRYLTEKPAKLRLRSQYSLRLYNWAKKYATVGSKRVSLDRLRKVLGLESIRDAEGNMIQEAPLPVWANLRQRALDTAISEINKKTDLKNLAGRVGAVEAPANHHAHLRHQNSKNSTMVAMATIKVRAGAASAAVLDQASSRNQKTERICPENFGERLCQIENDRCQN